VVILEGENLFLDQIGEVLEKGQVKSTRNRRACMRILMTVEEAKGVCKDRSKWKEVVSAQRETCVMLFMYVCSLLSYVRKASLKSFD
jgi:hypothetical protein